MNSIDKEYLINCNTNILGESIYRVFKIEHILEWFNTGKLAFCRLNKWEDPWEAYLFEHIVQTNKGLITLPYINTVYAQCWTLNEHENDMIWKLYSPNKNGVRIKSKVINILTSIKKSEEFFSKKYKYDPELFIGKVQYTKYIKRIPKSIKRLKEKKLTKQIMNIPFRKRKEFIHEKEFRFCYCTNNLSFNNLYCEAPKLIKFSVDPNDVIEEILFDPRMDQNLLNCYEDCFRFKCGFNKKIEQSKFYKI